MRQVIEEALNIGIDDDIVPLCMRRQHMTNVPCGHCALG